MRAYKATMAKVICCRRSSFFASIHSGGRVGLASVTVNHRGRRRSSRPPSVSCRCMNARADRTAPAAAKIHIAGIQTARASASAAAVPVPWMTTPPSSATTYVIPGMDAVNTTPAI